MVLNYGPKSYKEDAKETKVKVRKFDRPGVFIGGVKDKNTRKWRNRVKLFPFLCFSEVTFLKIIIYDQNFDALNNRNGELKG